MSDQFIEDEYLSCPSDDCDCESFKDEYENEQRRADELFDQLDTLQNEYNDLENEQRRADELLDQLDTLQNEYNRLDDICNDKLDELNEALEANGLLRLLLDKHKIEHEL